MTKKINTSKELNGLIETIVDLACKEGLTITELNRLINEQRKKVGMVQKNHKVEFHRDTTNEELLFKAKTYMFLKEYISLDDARYIFSYQPSSKETISQNVYEYHLKFFSEIIYAANILLNDNKTILMPLITDILWASGKFSNYSYLLRRTGDSVESLKNIALIKGIYSCTSKSKTLSYYVKLIKEKNIQ